MDRCKSVIELYMKSLEAFTEIENAPKDFGTGDLLYRSEIHSLQMIGDNPGINLTQLSEKMCVSKSAVSKFVKKLLEKQLITKLKYESNKKEVVFNLTEKGRAAYQGHEVFSKEMFGSIHAILADCTDEQILFMESFLARLVSEVIKVNDNIIKKM